MTANRMENSAIEQALYGSDGGRGYRFLARSPGFREEWSADAERLCTGFGERPAGVSCPECLFVQPFVGKQVAIVRAADRGMDSEGRPGTLQFHLLILSRALYDDLQGDPFHIAAALPPPWDARTELPTITWSDAAPAPRTVAALQAVLDVPNSATLLGGAQALLDGASLVFERRGPDARIVQSLWALLPASDRARLWPATYRFGNGEAFDVVVVPPKGGPESGRFVTEEKCGDYPEGRYELALQVAVEAGDQPGLDALLCRRSRRQIVPLALALLFVVISVLLVPLGLNLLSPDAPPATSPVNFPGAEEFPQLNEDERAELATRLQQLGQRLGTPLPGGSSSAELTATLAALDSKLGTPDPTRNSGHLADWGPVQRQLRILLWKHDVPEYNQRGLRTTELVDRLEKKLISEQKAP